MLKKMILSLLVLSTLVTLLAGCKLGKKKEGTQKQDPDQTTVEDGDGSYDFDGAEFTILTKEDTKYEFYSDAGLGGDVIDRAVYTRNYKVSQAYDATLKVVSKVGGWEQRTQFLSAVRAEAMGGSGGYDLVSSHSVYLGWMAVEGLAWDMATLPEMEFSNAWWNQNLYDEININGHVYFMLGDICTTTYEYMQVMFFNESMFEDYFHENANTIYDLVKSGKWTWSDCMTYAKAIGTNSEENTDYGLVMNIHSWRASFVSQDVNLYQRDENGDLYLPDAPSDKLVSVVDTMIELYDVNNKNILYHPQWDTGAGVLNPMFCGGNVLFYPQTLGEASTISGSMTDAYGVVPLPKYDEWQEMYYTICRDTVSAVMIMTTTDTPEMCGVLTEALCKESNASVIPEYYGMVLKNRYFTDAKYSEILDTIREGLTIIPVHNYVEDAPSVDMFHLLILGDDVGVVSQYNKHVGGGKTELATFYARMKQQGLY